MKLAVTIRLGIGLVIFLLPAVMGGQVEEIHDAAAAGDLDRVKRLIEERPDRIHELDAAGQTALNQAVIQGHHQVLRWLLSQGADPNRGSLGALMTGAILGDLPAMRLLLVHGADANLGQSGLSPVLHCAAATGHAGMTELLLEHGARMVPEEGDTGSGSTALHSVSGGSRVLESLHQEMQFLRDQIALIDADVDPERWDRLLAPANEREEVVELLLARGLDVDAATRAGATPLHYAARDGMVEVAECLLRHGADLHAVDQSGFTSLTFAAEYGQEAMAAHLLERGWRVDTGQS